MLCMFKIWEKAIRKVWRSDALALLVGYRICFFFTFTYEYINMPPAESIHGLEKRGEGLNLATTIRKDGR